MYASLSSTKKIWCWLILIFSWSVLPQEKMSIDYQGLQKFHRIPIEKDTRLNKLLQFNPIIHCEITVLHFNSSYLQAPLLDFRGSHNHESQYRLADRLAYTTERKTVWDLRETKFAFLFTYPANTRIQYQNSVVSKAPYPDELFENIRPPRHAILRRSGFVVFLIAGSVSYLYTRQYMTRKHAEMNNDEKLKNQIPPILVGSKTLKIPETSSRDSQDKQRLLSPQVIHDIRNQLHRFERETEYIDKELNVSNLAVKFGTNQRYLSHVINDYKKMPFPAYLKTLRITHAKKRLLEEPKLHRFSLEGLAGEFGFKSGRAFSIAFSEITGMPPSKLLEELRANGRRHDFLCGDDS